MQSAGEATTHSKILSGRNQQSARMSKQPFLTGSGATCRLPSRVQRPSNTTTGTILPSPADTGDTQTTPTRTGKIPEIQIIDPTPTKPLVRLSAAIESDDAASAPPEGEPESERPSAHPEQAIKQLRSMHQKVYLSKDRNAFANG